MRPRPPLNSLPAGLAAPDPSTFAVSYAAEANSIPRARRALRAFAEAGGATLAELDDIALASSEAITNVVQHAYVGIEGDVHVSARFKSRGLCIAVADDGL